MWRAARRRIELGWKLKAITLEGQGKSAEAERLVRRRIVLRPNDPDPHLVLATLLNLRRDNVGAARQAAKAAELAWDDPSVVYMAAARAVYGDLETCQRLVARVEELLREPGRGATFPFHTDLLHVNGQIALFSGEPQRARAMLALAYDADPTIGGLGYDLACAYIHEDRLEEAAAVVADALTYDPDSKRLLDLQDDLRSGSGPEG